MTPTDRNDPPFISGPFIVTVLGWVTFLVAIYLMGRDGN